MPSRTLSFRGVCCLDNRPGLFLIRNGAFVTIIEVDHRQHAEDGDTEVADGARDAEEEEWLDEERNNSA